MNNVWMVGDNLIADIEGSQKLGAIALQKINHKSELNFEKIIPKPITRR